MHVRGEDFHFPLMQCNADSPICIANPFVHENTAVASSEIRNTLPLSGLFNGEQLFSMYNTNGNVIHSYTYMHAYTHYILNLLYTYIYSDMSSQ